jgi:hypothetical protein
MRKMELRDGFGPLTEERVVAFEQQLGTRLPEDYREFLLETNGGRPTVPAVFRYADRSGPYTDSVVNWFYGLHEGHHYRLDESLTYGRAVIPSELFAIADDPGGNSICLVATGPERGKVYFFVNDGAGDADPELNRKQLHRISDSFEAFLDGLTED